MKDWELLAIGLIMGTFLGFVMGMYYVLDEARKLGYADYDSRGVLKLKYEDK